MAFRSTRPGPTQRDPPLPFRAIIDAASDGVAIIEPIDQLNPSFPQRFRWRYLNPRGSDILRTSGSDLDRVDVALSAPELAHHGILQQCMEAGRDEAKSRWTLGDGRELALRAGMFESYIVLRFRDVTSTVRLEKSELESRDRLEAILASISEAFLILDSHWRFSYLNEEAALLLRRSLGSLWGHYIWEELPELRGTEFERQLLRSGTERADVTFEIRYPIESDTWMFVRAYPSEIGVTVRLRDVSMDRRVAAHVADAQRAKSLTTLAGGIAHDFNNLLAVIHGHTAFLTDEFGPAHRGATSLGEINNAATRAQDLTRQLLAFSQQQMTLPALVELNGVIDALSTRLRERAGEAVEVQFILDESPVTVEVDPRELIQTMVDLIDNASDAMPTGGHLVIGVNKISLADSAAGPTGQFGVVAVTDTGTGMSPEVQARAAEPFFTHGRDGRRSGLGLAAADGMAKQAGGWLELDSVVGAGTVVRIFLPCTDHHADDVAAILPDGRLSTTSLARDNLNAGRSILIVDDNTSIRNLLSRLLSKAGYDVQTAASGPAALALAAVRSTPLDLLVTDVVMPGQSGFELAAAIAVDELGPAVLFMSGFTNVAGVVQPANLTPREFLTKPFTSAEMLQAVERLLAERDSRPERGD